MLGKLRIHRLKILTWVLGVLVITGAVFGAYKLGQRQIQPTPQPIPGLVATPTPEPTADWKTYINEQFKYSIKYPDNWTLGEFPDKTGAGFQPLSLPSGIENEVISVAIISRPRFYKDTPFEEYVNVVGVQDIEGFVELNSITPVVSYYGVSGYITTWKIEGIGKKQRGLSSPIAYLEVKPPRYQIEMGFEEKYDIIRLGLLREEYQDTFNLMLSTFKFLE